MVLHKLNSSGIFRLFIPLQKKLNLMDIVFAFKQVTLQFKYNYTNHVVQGTVLGKFHIHEVMGFVQRMLLRHQQCCIFQSVDFGPPSRHCRQLVLRRRSNMFHRKLPHDLFSQMINLLPSTILANWRLALQLLFRMNIYPIFRPLRKMSRQYERLVPRISCRLS